MFRTIILPNFRSIRLCIIPQAVTHSLVLLNMGKIIARNMLSWLELLISRYSLHLVGCLYYLYQWCTVKHISDNEIYLLIKYIKSVLSIVRKRLSYIEDARCLKVKLIKKACGPGSSVGITTDYGLDGPGIESRWGSRFSARPERPWEQPSLLHNGYRVFPGGKVRRGRAADHSPPSSAAVMESRAIPLPTLWATTGTVTGTLYLFIKKA